MKKLKLKMDEAKEALSKQQMSKLITGGYGGSCTGCEQTTPYGGCYVVNGNCVWIPEFGK